MAWLLVWLLFRSLDVLLVTLDIMLPVIEDASERDRILALSHRLDGVSDITVEAELVTIEAVSDSALALVHKVHRRAS